MEGMRGKEKSESTVEISNKIDCASNLGTGNKGEPDIVSSFDDLPIKLQQMIVNMKTNISLEEASRNLDVVLGILQFKTGTNFKLKDSKVSRREHPRATRLHQHNDGDPKDKEKDTTPLHKPLRPRPDVTPTRDLKYEADLLISTQVLRKHYLVEQSVTHRVSLFRSEKDNVKLAIKFLYHSFDDVKQQQANFQELRYLKFVKGHRNFVSFIRATLYNDELWVACECLGTTLKVATAYYKWKENQLRYIASHVLTALAYLQQNMIAHRNITSSHLMTDLSLGNIKLISLSHCAEFSQGPHVSMIGSPYYMAPEIILRKPYGVEVDVFSFGILMMELTNGELRNGRSFVKAMFENASKPIQVVFNEDQQYKDIDSNPQDTAHTQTIQSENTSSSHNTSKTSKSSKKTKQQSSVVESSDNTAALTRKVLQKDEWSPEYLDFLKNCLLMDPSKRWTAKQLLQHNWLTLPLPKKREMNELFGLISKKIEQVTQARNLQEQKQPENQPAHRKQSEREE